MTAVTKQYFGAHRAPLQSSQRKAIVLGFPQPQTHELVVQAIVDLRPECADNVFASGRNFLKVLRFKVEMSILPGFNRFVQRFSERNEVVKRTAAFIVIPADGRFGKVKMAVATRVIAFSEEVGVLFIRECGHV